MTTISRIIAICFVLYLSLDYGLLGLVVAAGIIVVICTD